MTRGEYLYIADTVAREKAIDREQVLLAMEAAMGRAGRTKYGAEHEIRAVIDRKTGAVQIERVRFVVELVENEVTQLSLEDAQRIKPGVQIGDEIVDVLPPMNFGRVAAQTAKQVIVQKVREAERSGQFEEFKDRVGEIVSATVKRVEFGNLTIDLGRAEAYIRRDELIPRENFRQGDRIRAYIYDVRKDARGPMILCSRTHPQFLAKLFAQEVPEIFDGIIEIRAVARDPGSRAKIIVYTSDGSIDPVGACVGMRGSRVQVVVQEMQGEKIDIIPWSDNPMVFARSALSPAEISSIRIDERTKAMEIMVEDTQLSLAIGKRGQNVRLAANITGWKLDIISKTKLQKRLQDAITNLVNIEGLSETMARALAQVGVLNIKQLSDTSLESLMKVPGFDDKEVAERYKAKAQALVDEGAPFVLGVQAASITQPGETTLDSKTSTTDQKIKELIQASEQNSEGATE